MTKNKWIVAAFVCGAPALMGLACDAQPVTSSVEPVREALATTLPSQPDVFGGTCIDATIPAPFDTAKTKVIHMSPSGNDGNDGSAAHPVLTLKHIHDDMLPAAGTAFQKDYQILVHGGTYYGQRLIWKKSDLTHRVHILALTDEFPVFDGRPSAAATASTQPFLIDFQVAASDGSATGNYTVSGLTIQNYFGYGLIVRGSCNRIYNNKIHQIGSSYASCVPDGVDKGYVADGCVDPDGYCRCIGYGGLDIPGASRSIFKHNDIMDAVNANYPDKDGNPTWKLIHPIYAYMSTNNLFEDNYIRNTNGNPVFKFRNGASNNRIYNNYMERAGGYCGVTGSCAEPNAFFTDSPNNANETHSTNNELSGNVATFPAGTQEMKLVDSSVYFPAPNDADQYTGKEFQGVSSSDEQVVATALADIDGDGKNEVFVALNYPTLGYSKIVYSDGGGSEPNLRTVAYSSNLWLINGLAAGNFTGTGTQVVASFYRSASSTSQISVGSLVNGVYRFTTKIGETTGASTVWHVSAMTAGKFGSDTTDKLITAAVVNGTQYVFRGDGKSAISGSSMPGVDNGTPLYSSSSWRINALTNGKVCGGTANSLVSGFTYVGTGSPLNRVYCGNGVTSVAETRLIDDASKVVTALAVGKFDGVNQRLATAVLSSGVASVYLSDGTNHLAQKLYNNRYWTLTALSAGHIETDGDADDELLGAFDNSLQTEVHWGDGATTSLGVTNRGVYYKN
jgi:hypothetical protein